MLDPSRTQGATPWKVFAWCYVAFFLIGVVRLVTSGTGEINPGALLIGPTLIAVVLTLVWWAFAGRKKAE